MSWGKKKAKSKRRLMLIRGIKNYKRKKYRLFRKKKLSCSKNINYESTEMPYDSDFQSNPEDLVRIFSHLNKQIDSKNTKSIFLDFKNVSKISIDTIMYILAIMTNKKGLVNFKGNFPEDTDARIIFWDSGFLEYVNSKIKKIIPRNPNKIRIKILNNADYSRKIFVSIINWIMSSFNIERKELRFLYVMLSELMTNTLEHAYNEDEKNKTKKSWFVYVNKKDDCTASFTFLDTGHGIPNTIYKNNFEKIQLLGINSDSKMLLSALNGDFRTQTGEVYRGKGIPKINEIVKSGKLKSFRLISGKGYVTFNNEEENYSNFDFKSELIGTLYYWEIDFSKQGEEKCKI